MNQMQQPASSAFRDGFIFEGLILGIPLAAPLGAVAGGATWLAGGSGRSAARNAAVAMLLTVVGVGAVGGIRHMTQVARNTRDRQNRQEMLLLQSSPISLERVQSARG